MIPTLRVGTRGSALALWQAQTVAEMLGERGVPTELVVIRTSGDRLQERPLAEDGGKRLFVKEIEEALLSGRVDLAVHSAKDMPSDDLAPLAIAAALPREDPRDALILPDGAARMPFAVALRRMPARPSIGTGSVRRVAQISALARGARCLPAREILDEVRA